jgi:hypothetical protein
MLPQIQAARRAGFAYFKQPLEQRTTAATWAATA